MEKARDELDHLRDNASKASLYVIDLLLYSIAKVLRQLQKLEAIHKAQQDKEEQAQVIQYEQKLLAKESQINNLKKERAALLDTLRKLERMTSLQRRSAPLQDLSTTENPLELTQNVSQHIIHETLTSDLYKWPD
jgi:hypothetical protein